MSKNVEKMKMMKNVEKCWTHVETCVSYTPNTNFNTLTDVEIMLKNIESVKRNVEKTENV